MRGKGRTLKEREEKPRRGEERETAGRIMGEGE